jgi:hypothetical protein
VALLSRDATLFTLLNRGSKILFQTHIRDAKLVPPYQTASLIQAVLPLEFPGLTGDSWEGSPCSTFDDLANQNAARGRIFQDQDRPCLNTQLFFRRQIRLRVRLSLYDVVSGDQDGRFR